MDAFSSAFWGSGFASRSAYWEPTTSLPPVDSLAKMNAVDNALTTAYEKQGSLAESSSPSGQDVTVSLSQNALAASSNWTMSLSTTSEAASQGADASQELTLNVSGETSGASFISWFGADGSVQVSQFASDSASYQLSITAAVSQSSLQIESSLLASEIHIDGNAEEIAAEMLSSSAAQSSTSYGLDGSATAAAGSTAVLWPHP